MTSTTQAPRLFGEHFLTKLESTEQAMVHKVRQLVREHIGPRAAQVARQDVFAWENFSLLARERVLATAFPQWCGGTDARQTLKIRIIEELGRVCSASASMMTGADLSTRAVVVGASQELQQKLVPGLCEGTLQCAFALTEPEAGSDVRGLQTTMEQDGDHYVIHGTKKYITRATTADWFVVIGKARHAPSSFIAVLVPRGALGFHISPEVPKLGWHGVPISSLAFEGVRVPMANRLGQEGDGFELAQDALVRARIGHASMAIGRAIGAVEIAANYACDRSLFGKSLGDHQGVQWMLADMVSQIEAARCLVALAAEKYDQGDADVSVFASMAKLQATDLCMKVVTDALQLTGGRGYLQDFPLERFFRDAKLNQIGEGSSEVHKTVIGRDIVRRAPQSERNACLRPGSLADY